jgi:hypothetical protein
MKMALKIANSDSRGIIDDTDAHWRTILALEEKGLVRRVGWLDSSTSLYQITNAGLEAHAALEKNNDK